MQVKAIPGLGTTIDVILVNGTLREGDTMVLAGHEGPFTTPIRSLLMPQPLKELRVKNPYQEYKEVKGAQGVKIAAKDLDKAIAGLQVLVAKHPDEVEVLKVWRYLHAGISSGTATIASTIKLTYNERGSSTRNGCNFISCILSSHTRNSMLKAEIIQPFTVCHH